MLLIKMNVISVLDSMTLLWYGLAVIVLFCGTLQDSEVECIFVFIQHNTKQLLSVYFFCIKLSSDDLVAGWIKSCHPHITHSGIVTEHSGTPLSDATLVCVSPVLSWSPPTS